MRLWSTGLIGENESSANPDTRCTEHQSRGNCLTVEDTSSSNNLDWLAGQGALVTLNELGDGGDKDGSRGVSGVATTLTTLSADDVDANIQALLNVFRVADHVHVQDAMLVKAFNDMLRGNTDSGDEEFGATVDDYGDQLVKLALGVIIASTRQLTCLSPQGYLCG